MTAHAMEEMAEDYLDLLDVEKAALTGKIGSIRRDDPRGTRYVVIGTAADGTRPVAVVGRFVETDRFLIITVYEVS